MSSPKKIKIYDQENNDESSESSDNEANDSSLLFQEFLNKNASSYQSLHCLEKLPNDSTNKDVSQDPGPSIPGPSTSRDITSVQNNYPILPSYDEAIKLKNQVRESVIVDFEPRHVYHGQYIDIPYLLTLNDIPDIGTELILITFDQCRWSGTLISRDSRTANEVIYETITLQNVRAFGTEDRRIECQEIPDNFLHERECFSLYEINIIFVKKSSPTNDDKTNEEWISIGPEPVVKLSEKYLKIPNLLTIDDLPVPGTNVYLIRDDESRWYGKVLCHESETKDNIIYLKITLEYVRSFGTEDRQSDFPSEPARYIAKKRTFSFDEIKNIYVKQTSPENDDKTKEEWISIGPGLVDTLPQKYLDKPGLLTLQDIPTIGTKVFIVTIDDYQWLGTIVFCGSDNSGDYIHEYIQLENVRSYGKKDNGPIIPDTNSYTGVDVKKIFFLTNIKDIYDQQYFNKNPNDPTESPEVKMYWVSKGSGPKSIVPDITKIKVFSKEFFLKENNENLRKEILIKEGNYMKQIRLDNMPKIMTEMFIITNEQVRLYGRLSGFFLNPAFTDYFFLTNVRNFGTENRKTSIPLGVLNIAIPSMKIEYDEISNLFYKRYTIDSLNPSKTRKEEWITRGPGPLLEIPEEYLQLPDLLTMRNFPDIGTEIFLIGKDLSRWFGKIIRFETKNINGIFQDYVILANVRSFGTEDRYTNSPHPRAKFLYREKYFSIENIINIYYQNKAESNNQWICKGPGSMPEPITDSYLNIPELLIIKNMPAPGTWVFLLTEDDCRWYGKVVKYESKTVDDIICESVFLRNVCSFGTEERPAKIIIPAADEIFRNVIISISTIRNICYTRFFFKESNDSSQKPFKLKNDWIFRGCTSTESLSTNLHYPPIQPFYGPILTQPSKNVSRGLRTSVLINQAKKQEQLMAFVPPRRFIPPKNTEVIIIDYDQIRYRGIINGSTETPNKNKYYLHLLNVRNFGTENRPSNYPVAPSKFIVKSVTISSSKISNAFYKVIINDQTVEPNVNREEWIVDGPGKISQIPEWFLKLPPLLTINDLPEPGTEVFLIMYDECRWFGVISNYVSATSANIVFDNFTLGNALLFGTEDRATHYPVPPNKKVLEEENFFVASIKNIYYRNDSPTTEQNHITNWIIKGPGQMDNVTEKFSSLISLTNNELKQYGFI